MNKTLMGAIQMASGPSVAANLIEAERLLEVSAGHGVKLAVLPENFALMGLAETDKLEVSEDDGQGPIQDFLAGVAKRHKMWVVGGTIPIRSHKGKVMASCLVHDDKGNRVGRYDKIHLFDVNVPGTEESYKESATIDAGQEVVVLDTPFGRLGLAVCYDLRFPELFRSMAASGMEILAVPSAFTAKTGAAHWELLVRTRSVENQCYTIAANQGGFHMNGRETYGRSMVVDPWGTVLSTSIQGSAVVTAEYSPTLIKKVRSAFPVLEHIKLNCRYEPPGNKPTS